MSLMSREDMLRELELLPVWQLRTPLKAKAQVADAAAPAVIEPQPAVSESPAIEVIAIESPVTEPMPPDSLPEAVPLQEMEVAESFETAAVLAPVSAPVSEQVRSSPLRLLLSEDSAYAFLIEPYSCEGDAETLLKNMIRAMQASYRVDVTDAVDKVFIGHAPRLIISFGAEPANLLLGKTRGLVEWRNTQQETQPRYENIPLIVTYHPAQLLQNPADKVNAWHDLCLAMKLMQSL